MKKIISCIALIGTILVSTFAINIKSSNGIAGYTGSPGETRCTNCHGIGASAASKSIRLDAVPSFSANEYTPDSVYTLTITVKASGFSKYGFGCEILNDDNLNAGLMSSAGIGVKFLNAGNGRKNAVQTSTKNGVDSTKFSFKWTAPAVGSGNATIFVSGNAVNGTGGSGGDLTIPGTFVISEGAVPSNTLLGVGLEEKNKSSVNLVTLYPNPSNGISNVAYTLKNTKAISIQLIDVTGKIVSELVNETSHAGYHSHTLNLQSFDKGIYFISIIEEGKKVSQKLIILN
jgi:hypothetical protein